MYPYLVYGNLQHGSEVNAIVRCDFYALTLGTTLHLKGLWFIYLNTGFLYHRVYDPNDRSTRKPSAPWAEPSVLRCLKIH